MYPVSDRFFEAIQQSHKMVTRLEVQHWGATVAEIKNLTSGSVTVDRTSKHRRKCQITIKDPTGELVPVEKDDILSPYSGNELKIMRGVQYDDGTQEFASLGLFGIAAVNVSDTGEDFEIKVEGYDRSRRISRARFTDTFHVSGSNKIETVVEMVLLARTPDIPARLDATDSTVRWLTWQMGDDPWEKLAKLCVQVGYDLFVDPDGYVRLIREPDPGAQLPILVFRDSDETESRLLTVTKEFDNEKLYNFVVVSGETSGSSSSNVVRAEAAVTNPAHPLYYKGPYGEVPYFYSSKLIGSEYTAQIVAYLILLRVIHSAEEASFLAAVNPALDVNDTVQVERARMRMNSVYLVDRLSVPLHAQGSMHVTLRKRIL